METTLNKASKWHLSEGTKRIIVDVIVYLFVALFVYTAASKFMTFESFNRAFDHSKYIGGYSRVIAFMIISVELIVSFLLIIPATKKIGLLGSLLLMIVFTSYLVFTFLSGNELPCGCGGIISTMNWKEHIWFNIVYLLMACIGIFLYKK